MVPTLLWLAWRRLVLLLVLSLYVVVVYQDYKVIPESKVKTIWVYREQTYEGCNLPHWWDCANEHNHPVPSR